VLFSAELCLSEVSLIFSDLIYCHTIIGRDVYVCLCMSWPS